MALRRGEGAGITDTFVQDPKAAGSGSDGSVLRAPSFRDRFGWRPPSGRDLLAGVAVLAVLFAILVVYTSDAAPPRHDGGPQALPLPGASGARPAPVAWSDVPVAMRVTELGPALARPVAEGLAGAREKLARCVANDRRRRETPPTPAPAQAVPAEIVLSLAARAGAVHVEAVEVRSPGASPDLVVCARRLLAGAAFPAPAAVPGRRYRLAHVLE